MNARANHRNHKSRNDGKHDSDHADLAGLAPQIAATSSKESSKLFTRSVPPHLDRSTWLDYEGRAALDVFGGLKRALRRLCKKASASRVHDARVNLRRFDAIWKVLKQDGWESKSFKRSVGNDLKEVRRMLGALRDWDVNIELSRSMGLPDELIDSWQVERELVATQIKEELNGWDVELLLEDLKKYLKKRRKKLAKRGKKLGVNLKDSAYKHLEPYLLAQEVISSNLAAHATTAEDLHRLRLSIKTWRYILAEFFGLTNLELVRAQQILGKLNDLGRIRALVLEHPSKNEAAEEALNKLSLESDALLDKFREFRNNLPFGLRPSTSSRRTCG